MQRGSNSIAGGIIVKLFTEGYFANQFLVSYDDVIRSGGSVLETFLLYKEVVKSCFH